jgi:hypothetical protein
MAVGDAGHGEHGSAELDVAVAPFEYRGRAGIHGQNYEVGVDVDTLRSALQGATVGEGDQGRDTAKVVGVGQDQAVADHDAATAPAVPPDADNGWSDALSDAADGGLQVVDGGHGSLRIIFASD